MLNLLPMPLVVKYKILIASHSLFNLNQGWSNERAHFLPFGVNGLIEYGNKGMPRITPLFLNFFF